LSIVYQRVLARLQYGLQYMGGRHLVLGRRFLGVGQGTAEVDVWRVSLDLVKFIVGQHCLCEGLLLLLALGSESMGCHAAEAMDFPGRPRGRGAP
jgi:hypothetical protein